MSCHLCGHDNPDGNRFCGGCGAALARACPACGHGNPADHRFCGACGALLTAEPAGARREAGSRKVVTIVFADLVGSTALHERLDAESVRHVMDRYYRALRAAVESHRGTVVKLLGDGVMAAFGVPRVAEDDAVRAVRAAVEIVEAVRRVAPTRLGEDNDTQTANRVTANRLAIRIGVNTGEVVVGAGNADIVGDPVNVAARLQQGAGEDEVLIGEATQRLVGELVTLQPSGELSLKGRSETVNAYRVLSLEAPAPTTATAFVGRDDELRRISAAYDDAVARRTARLIVVISSPGLGKSRIVAEAVRRLGERSVVIEAHCDAGGRSTFAPLGDALRALLGVSDSADLRSVRAAIEKQAPATGAEGGRVANGVAALLTGTPESAEETFFAVRRFLAALAAARGSAQQPRPVLLAIDDLHWGEPLLLDLIEHLAQWTVDVPLLMLLAARPELRDLRATLTATGGLVADVVSLSGLDAGAATRLAVNAVGAAELPAAVVGRVLAISEGNPLFVGELLRMLVHDGTLKREGNRWATTVELAELEMPPTIHALLAARIERLRPQERTVLERAAVLGRHFSRAAVAQLLPPEIEDLDACLESLRRSELVESDAGRFLGEPALRFHHALIRDAAYRRLLKGTRAELHARFADWVETRAGQDLEHGETIGWHLEQAHQLLAELGPIDAAGRAFGERAARYLAAAGRRALERDDVARAANLLGRAVERLDSNAPAAPESAGDRADLILDWCEALLSAGDLGTATRPVGELERLGGDSQRLRAWHVCFAVQLAVLTDPDALLDNAAAVETAATVLASLGDFGGEAKAHSVHAAALARLGRIGAAEAALDRALAAARNAGDRRRANAVLAGAPLAALWGPSPVTRASGRCLDVVRVLRITQGAPAVEAVALRCQAVLEALRGRTEAARRMIASSRRMVEELGITPQLLETEMFAGLVELLDGESGGAERRLRAAYDGLRDYGLGIDAARAAALLGRALLEQGHAAEAESLSRESEALAGDDLKAAIAWRGVRAEALARRGLHRDAIELARAAVDIAAATDALLDHADARLALAVALRAAGRQADADKEDLSALDLWTAKGATLLTERARGTRTVGARDVDTVTVDRLLRFENAASRSQTRFENCWRARDLEGIVAVYQPTVVMDDHRSLVGVALAGESFFDNLRYLFSNPSIEWNSTLLATRGDRLALFRHCLTGELGDRGAFGAEHLAVIEVDGEGRCTAVALFDPDAIDAARAELDGRYSGGEGRAYAAVLAHQRAFADATDARDWEGARRQLPDDFTMLSHRRFANVGRRLDGDEFIASLQWAHDRDVRIKARFDHIPRLSPRSLVSVATFVGTADGGVFEQQVVFVVEHDGQQIRSFELFDLDQLDAALARHDELSGTAARSPGTIPDRERVPTTAATVAACRIHAAFMARDWEAMRAACQPDARFEDRRRHALLAGDLDWWIADARGIVETMPDVRYERQLIGAFGRRIALERVLWTGAPSDARAEVEYIRLTAVDADGRIAAVIGFDLDNLAAARREAEERALAEGAAIDSAVPGAQASGGNAASRMRERINDAFHSRDWSRMRQLACDDMVFEDRRKFAGMSGGVDLWVKSAQAIQKVTRVEFKDDLIATLGERIDIRRRGITGVGPDGESFYVEFVVLTEVDVDGRLATSINFDPEARVEALAEGRKRAAAGDE
jgi:class 3 adenylate cyclase/tetratricopeptide (TPR) repeat protein